MDLITKPSGDSTDNSNEENVTAAVDVSEAERKRREAVWELCKSECVFLIDHLMALKHVRTLVYHSDVFRFLVRRFSTSLL